MSRFQDGGPASPLGDRSLHGILLGNLVTLAAGIANDWSAAPLSVLAFTLAHGYSLWWNESRAFKDRKPNLGTLMFSPYLRIIPMHLTIIIGSTATSLALPLFIGLKTLSDCGIHLVEHAIFRRGGMSGAWAGVRKGAQ